MKIYVVTSGEYSDYCINAVFIQKEKAMEYIAIRAGQSDFSDVLHMEEYDTMDDSDLTDGGDIAIVCYDTENNIIKHIKYINSGSLEASLSSNTEYSLYREIFRFSIPAKSRGIEAIRKGDGDYSILKKIAQDRLAKYIAQRAGIT